MKKTRIILSALAAIALTTTAVSCHDNIYYLINQEVPQQTGLGGDINNIIAFKGYLYTANSKVYKKVLKSSSETGAYNYQWQEVKATCNGKKLEFIHTLVADDTNLYCYATQWLQDKDKSLNIGYYKCLYTSTDGENWTQIDISTVTNLKDDAHGSYSASPVVLFDNKKGDGKLTAVTGRKAYVRLTNNQDSSGSSQTKIYSLSGGSLGSATTAPENTLTAINLGGADIFQQSPATTSNGTYGYRSKGSMIEQINSSGTVMASSELNSGTIYSMAATKNYILLGTSSGIYRVALDSTGKPANSVSGFDNNAQTLLTSRVPCVYVLDSSKDEGSTDEYASMVIYGYLTSSSDSFNETGLYAYYPGRGNWNRDGN